MSYLNSKLIEKIKRRARIPDNQNGFLDSDLLELADDEIRVNLLPTILKAQEEYYSFDHDITVTIGRASYPIPPRAIANKLNNVFFISGDTFKPLERLSETDKESISETREGFYVKNNNIIISPVPTNATDILRLCFYIRPSDLVLETDCAEISAIDTVLKQVTVLSIPSTITTLNKIDFVKAQPGFQCLEISKSILSISGMVFEFSSLPDDLAIGDYICLENTSPIAQVPIEFHVVLIQAVTAVILDSLSDSKTKQADEKLILMKNSMLDVISPRVDGAPKKIKINL